MKRGKTPRTRKHCANTVYTHTRRAERYETSVDKLLWVPVRRPGSVAASSSALSSGLGDAAGGTGAKAGTPSSVSASTRGGGSQGPMLLLSCGGDGLMRVWQITSVGKLLATLPAAQVRGVAWQGF